MKTSLLLAAVAGLTLVSAAPPADPIPWEDEESLQSYPPCSRSVTDRCIQTNERGADTRENLAGNDEMQPDGNGPPVDGAASEPTSYAATDYPPCSATVTDSCIQTGRRGSRGSMTRMARTPEQKHKARHTQLAMRAGERG